MDLLTLITLIKRKPITRSFPTEKLRCQYSDRCCRAASDAIVWSRNSPGLLTAGAVLCAIRNVLYTVKTAPGKIRCWRRYLNIEY